MNEGTIHETEQEVIKIPKDANQTIQLKWVTYFVIQQGERN